MHKMKFKWILKNKIQNFNYMSFNKLEKKNLNTFKARNLEVCLNLQQFNYSSEVFKSGRFYVNPYQISFYGLSKHREKRHLRLNNDNLLMSIVLAVFYLTIYGVMGTKKIMNFGIIEYFVCEMFDWINSHKDNASRQFVIIMVNAIVYSSLCLGSFLKKCFDVVTSTTCSPALNICDNAINVVKCFIKQKKKAEN